MQFMEPIFTHVVHAQSIGYSLTRIDFSRKVRKIGHVPSFLIYFH